MSGLRRALLKGLARALAWSAERLAAAAEPPPPITPAPPRRRPSQVLVVDDDVANQRAAIALLAGMDMRATAAGNGEEALAMLRGLRFDLILMDCDMPVMDGPDTVRAIRGGAAGADNAALPIIGITSDVGARGPHGMAAGMNRVLSKPLGAEHLAPAIAGILAVTDDVPETSAPGADADDTAETPAADAPTPTGKRDRPTPPRRSPPTTPAPTLTDAPRQGPPPVFDEYQLLDGFGNDRLFARQVVAATRSELPKRLGQLEKAVVAADWEKAQHLAGIMESQASQIGGRRLATQLGQIEGRLKQGGRLDSQQLLALKLAVSELDDALRDWA